MCKFGKLASGMAKGDVPSQAGTPCSWLLNVSEVERRRRLLALHRTCERLLAVEPAHRPRSLDAFARFTKQARQVRSFSISPVQLAERLGCAWAVVEELKDLRPPGLLVHDGLEEDVDDEVLHHVRQRLRHVRGMTAKGEAQFIESVAAVTRCYEAVEVVAALREVGLLGESLDHVDARSVLSWELLASRLSKMPFLCCATWRSMQSALDTRITGSVSEVVFKLTVTLPLGCAGSFIGVRASGLETKMRSLNERAKDLPVSCPPTVVLKAVRPKTEDGQQIKSGPSCLLVVLRWSDSLELTDAGREDKKNAVRAFAHSIAGEITDEVQGEYRRQLQKSSRLREAHKESYWQQGEEYHAERRRVAAERRLESGAARAVRLPEAGHQEPFARHRRGRHHHLRYRRAAAAWEKRKVLLRVAATLTLWPEPWEKIAGSPSARRFLRQVKSCSAEEGEAAVEALRASRCAADAPCRTSVLTAPRELRQRRPEARGPREQRRRQAVRGDLGLDAALDWSW